MPATFSSAPPRRRVRRIRLAASTLARLSRGYALVRRVARALGWRRCAWTVLATVVAWSVAFPAVRGEGEADPQPFPLSAIETVASSDGRRPVPAGAELASASGIRAVIVAPGDTLWDIAGRIARPGEDVRAVVERLRMANGLTGAGLVEGQALLLAP